MHVPDTVQARNPVPTKCTECRGHKAQCPSAVWEPGQPQLAKAGGSGHCRGACREPRPTTPVLAGNNPLRPGACWGRAATLSAPRQALRPAGIGTTGRLTCSPQPVVVPEPAPLHSFLLRPRRRHRDRSLHAPQYTADELGPGAVFPRRGRSGRPPRGMLGYGVPRPPDSMSLHQEGELSAPQPSAARSGRQHPAF